MKVPRRVKTVRQVKIQTCNFFWQTEFLKHWTAAPATSTLYPTPPTAWILGVSSMTWLQAPRVLVQHYFCEEHFLCAFEY